jgi:hypothetical protein
LVEMLLLGAYKGVVDDDSFNQNQFARVV